MASGFGGFLPPVSEGFSMSRGHLESSGESDSSLSTSKGGNSMSRQSSLNTVDNNNNAKQSKSEREEQRMKHQIIKREELHVRRARWTVFTAVLLCGIVCSLLVYFFAVDSDEQSFELEYNSFTKTITDLVQWEVQYNFALMQQMSGAVTNEALVTNTSFPYLTLRNYEIAGGYVDGMGGIMTCVYAPLITANQVEAWQNYSVEHQGWIQESARLKAIHPTHRDALHGTIQDHEHGRRRRLVQTRRRRESVIDAATNALVQQQQQSSTPNISGTIYRWDGQGHKVKQSAQPGQLVAPLWQSSPADASAVNVDLLSDARVVRLFDALLAIQELDVHQESLLSAPTPIGDLFDWLFDPEEKPAKQLPHAFLMEPVYNAWVQDATLVGFLLGVTVWENLVNFILPPGANGIIVVISDSCGNVMTFQVNGPTSVYLGEGDFHDRHYENYKHQFPLEVNVIEHELVCVHEMTIYPSAEFRSSYNSNGPAIYTAIVAGSFAIMALLLVVYDIVITRRQEKTMKSFLQTNKVVRNLFPENVRDRLLQDRGQSKKLKNDQDQEFLSVSQRLMASGGASSVHLGEITSKPIADFFPFATVLFADLKGFTAWSSTREPFHVFTLLETLYGAFDAIAKKRGVFKVETVGDCYVATCGLPRENDRHAVVMVRFAAECLVKCHEVCNMLEVTLGPDTADLGFRVGIHSGPITAGVLRGDNARFQLFGDTVNTGARMESSGEMGRIHVSKETADLIKAAGKGRWIVPRSHKVQLKGKGEMQTYWARPPRVRRRETGNHVNSTTSSSATPTGAENENYHDDDELDDLLQQPEQSAFDKTARLVDYNVEVLARCLKQVIAHRCAMPMARGQPREHAPAIIDESQFQLEHPSSEARTVDEIQEYIVLPRYNEFLLKRATKSVEAVELDRIIVEQLTMYVRAVAASYRDNEFHSFEHASHVTMSVTKLLSRIVAPSDKEFLMSRRDMTPADCSLDSAYGITSDPLTQFACVLSAIIHDADHSGVPNAQLIKEQTALAAHYKNKSVAEQNSVDIAWSMLMQDEYRELRATIYTTQEELQRFRHLVVNSVMATDISDKDLKADRNSRWSKAFSAAPDLSDDGQTAINRKATIVIEHLIQASDIAHTMQHWHVYRKWNEKFYRECYRAYKQGRAEKNPADYWYQGEIGFFDFYIIPLAKKLKDCGVFGVSSDEYLNYAEWNRKEWEDKGREIVSEMVEKYSND